jgi:Zn-finger nucleic acid-binding protein
VVYREQVYRCLECRTDLERVGLRLGCPSCLSAMVTVPDLEQMLRKMAPDGVSVPIEVESYLRPMTAPQRGCPCCGDPMRTYRFVDLPVDRCDEHGVWFDRKELEDALRGAERLRLDLAAARDDDDDDDDLDAVTLAQGGGGILQALFALLR